MIQILALLLMVPLLLVPNHASCAFGVKNECKVEMNALHGHRLNRKIAAVTAPPLCIHFGAQSVSKRFKKAVSIYHTQDGFRILYDGNDSRITETPPVSQVEVDVSRECELPNGEKFKGQIYQSRLDRMACDQVPDALASRILKLQFPPQGACSEKRITIKLQRKKCIFGSVNCNSWVTEESFEILPSDLSWLPIVDDSASVPCLED